MTNISENRDRANALKTQGNYADALLLFQGLWEETKDKWDGWNLAYCYNKLKQFEEALDISKKVYASDKDYDYIKGTYAWAAFMLNINSYDGDNYDELRTFSDGIMTLTEDRQDDVFRHLTVLKIMDFCDNKGMWDALISWSARLDPQILNSKPYKFKKNGKNITIPSNREKWFQKTTKAYEKLENCMNVLVSCKLLPKHLSVLIRRLREGSASMIELCKQHKLTTNYFFIFEKPLTGICIPGENLFCFFFVLS